jgi:hypothetical protein
LMTKLIWCAWAIKPSPCVTQARFGGLFLLRVM